MTNRALQSAAQTALVGSLLACIVAVVVMPFSLPVAQGIFLVALCAGVVACAAGSWFE